ncbi:MAG TPA: YqgE/AlgH family protein [Chromatiales bacterium]|nr:YqgE/AlgH family protein [Chromatiales bacterium]
METQTTNLTGHLLIAMPAMLDPNFSRSVIYICEHSDQGSLGLVINRPTDMELGTVFEQLSLTAADPDVARTPILAGGPVSQERGFVIHDACPDWESTIEVGNALFVTTSRDILTAIAAGQGPDHALLALGYAGWGAGQLEQELSANAWLSVPASPQIIFDTPFEQRWQKAAELLGIDLVTISSQAGHA